MDVSMNNGINRHETNEIVIFLVNLFFLEVIGRFIVTLTLFLFRFFDMEQVADAYYALPRHSFYTFFIILCIVTLVSISRIVMTQRKRAERGRKNQE
ncbi:MAG: hypothetical protein IJV06_03250 [Bacteroidaceae bacterium]|nr:hypothetical protein [Bacteroidaceae bacterium]